MKIERIRNPGIRKFIKIIFLFFEKIGLHLTPNHYYMPIPDTRTLGDDLWLRHSELVGINIRKDEQIHLLSTFSSKFKSEYEKIPQKKSKIPYDYHINNGEFESVDGEILYCMIRHFRPKKIFEILSAVERNNVAR